MAGVLHPRDGRDAREALAAAAGAGEAVEIVGGGTWRTLGFPDRERKLLSMAAISRVIDYDPAELVLSVEPGASLAEIEALLAQSDQMLAFEPWDFAEATDEAPGRATIGGVIGSGLAGSRRISAGGVRDYMLGVVALNGLGQEFKAGGRVVKNVTGYDLPRLMAGSWGQLAVLMQVTLKVLPRPREVRTLAIQGLEAKMAVRAMSAALGSPAEVAAAGWTRTGDGATTAFRIEGFGPSVEARVGVLGALLRDFGQVQPMSEPETFWTRMRNATVLPREAGPVLWRICVPPAHGASVVMGVERLGGAALMDWAGGLVWARLPADMPAHATRTLAQTAGGHAMLADAPEAVRRSVPALHPEQRAVAALSRRVREAFDPAHVFDPHRFEASAR